MYDRSHTLRLSADWKTKKLYTHVWVVDESILEGVVFFFFYFVFFFVVLLVFIEFVVCIEFTYTPMLAVLRKADSDNFLEILDAFTAEEKLLLELQLISVQLLHLTL